MTMTTMQHNQDETTDISASFCCQENLKRKQQDVLTKSTQLNTLYVLLGIYKKYES